MSELSILEIARTASETAARAKSWADINNLFAKHIYMIRSGFEKKDFETLWSVREDICYMVNGKGFSGRKKVYDCYVEAKDAVRSQMLNTLSDLLPDEAFDPVTSSGAGEYELSVPMTPFIEVAKDNRTARAVWSAPTVAVHAQKDGTCHSYVGTIVFYVDFINENGCWKIWHLRQDDEVGAQVPNVLARTLENAMKGIKKAGGPGGPPHTDKKTILKMMAEGKSPPGRTGELVRTLQDLPPASPASNLSMVDRPDITLLAPHRFIDDIVDPYITWDDSLSVIRDC